MSYMRLALIAGFAMFSMFFGSGNLVFPISIGVQTGSQFSPASVGLILTGVAVPFLGLLAMIYHSGNLKLFFQSLGAPVAFLLTFAMLSLMGPFGVLPRCIIVAQGGVELIVPALKPEIFNGLFCLATAFLAWQKQKIVEIIGTFLTPGLLIGIVALITMGIWLGPAPEVNTMPADQAFMVGFNKGYQTMDLLAAFFFSATTVAFIASALTTHKDKANIETLSLNACFIGAFLLTIVYLGFVYLGAEYAPYLRDTAPEKLLVAIAELSLGNFSLPIAAVIIALACLTTATILASLFADFLHRDILQSKVPRSLALIATLGFSYTVSLIGFGELANWIANALSIAYPALITYAIAKIIGHKTRLQVSYQAFWFVLFVSISAKIALNFLVV